LPFRSARLFGLSSATAAGHPASHRSVNQVGSSGTTPIPTSQERPIEGMSTGPAAPKSRLFAERRTRSSGWRVEQFRQLGFNEERYTTLPSPTQTSVRPATCWRAAVPSAWRSRSCPKCRQPKRVRAPRGLPFRRRADVAAWPLRAKQRPVRGDPGRPRWGAPRLDRESGRLRPPYRSQRGRLRSDSPGASAGARSPFGAPRARPRWRRAARESHARR
jgi:hypothetical protein